MEQRNLIFFNMKRGVPYNKMGEVEVQGHISMLRYFNCSVACVSFPQEK